jgi:protoporphyrinogen/coproporphyrinogen III oxidase
VVRASVGRRGEESVLQRDDADLVDLVLGDLTDALGVTDPPLDARVSRWGGGLPQYTVGHRRRVARVKAAVEELPGLAVAGAAYDGVGVPACIASGQQAAAAVLRQWEL